MSLNLLEFTKHGENVEQTSLSLDIFFLSLVKIGEKKPVLYSVINLLYSESFSRFVYFPNTAIFRKAFLTRPDKRKD